MIIPFQPTALAPFQFQATLDGAVYNIICSWGMFGARYYVNCYALDGTWIFTRALLGSPTGINVQSVSWANGVATVTLVAPLFYRVGQTLKLTLAGMSPDAWNGTFIALVTSAKTITFNLAENPGQATVLGVVNQDISLTDGYFASTLVYRVANRAFEITP